VTIDRAIAIKSLKQNYCPSDEILNLLEQFRRMVNDCIAIGLRENVSTLKSLSLKAYHELSQYSVPSYYKLCAISRASGILASRKKSIRRGMPTRNPYAVKPQLTSCYGFKIKDGRLHVPLGNRRFVEIRLNRYTQGALSEQNLRVRSFTPTASTMSICISKEVRMVECVKYACIDRNLRNVTYGNEEHVVNYSLSKCVKIVENTKEIVASFKRNDERIRQKIASKYGLRRRNSVNYILHCTTKDIVERAFENREAIVLEDIRGIRLRYRKGYGYGRKFRGMMNSWAFGEVARQIGYKALWKGIPIIHLTKGETKGTSNKCHRCGERLQVWHGRELFCPFCNRVVDRDVEAVINISRRGRWRFARSMPYTAKGGAVEAMMGNPTPTVILRVDAPKSRRRLDGTFISLFRYSMARAVNRSRSVSIPTASPSSFTSTAPTPLLVISGAASPSERSFLTEITPVRMISLTGTERTRSISSRRSLLKAEPSPIYRTMSTVVTIPTTSSFLFRGSLRKPFETMSLAADLIEIFGDAKRGFRVMWSLTLSVMILPDRYLTTSYSVIIPTSVLDLPTTGIAPCFFKIIFSRTEEKLSLRSAHTTSLDIMDSSGS